MAEVSISIGIKTGEISVDEVCANLDAMSM